MKLVVDGQSIHLFGKEKDIADEEVTEEKKEEVAPAAPAPEKK